MAEDMALLDDLFDDFEPLQNKEKEVVKFKPKNVKNLPKPSVRQSQHADPPLGAHLDNSPLPNSATDKFEGASNPKTKLQPQRRKQPAAPGSDGPSDINRTEMPDHENEGNLSKSDFEAPTSFSEIDFLDNVSLDPLFSSAELTINLQPKENEIKGKKVRFSVPEEYSAESPDRLINQGSVTSEEIQANDASESGVEEHTQNDEQGQNYGNTGEKENEDAPNLDDIFNFSDDTDPIIEMDEANEDHTDGGYTGEEEVKGRPEKEVPIDAGKRSKRKTRGSTDANANVEEEGSPKKKGKLSHRIRRKRRTVDPVLLQTPENEINPKQISIRNLILLAEAKEKKWNKEAASGNGDASSMPRRRQQEEFEFFDFEGDEEEHSRQDSAPQETFQATVKKLNYHTYMNRTSSSRWTQSETELFYKGIRQFGTDFAMIQQLFPNRTRHQIKLKFKSEDKKHPTHVRDAITHRLTDNSQFEKVIEILEIQADKVAPEESEPSYQADPWKNEEEADENFKTSPNDLDNSGKHDSVPNDDLDAVFNWDNEELGQEDFVF
ncbi:Transcription factor TFIIIB component B'' [Carex littledalei]|uniref:Transcription factor TFIIIB component B n=1 Tax=Carex littledalei TaxID=544730 RepID=A0A833R0G6_9POAL|nr:Transcription factor TFIIIB component B'' [Carex littledalei]